MSGNNLRAAASGLARAVSDLRAAQRTLPPEAIDLACHVSLPVAVDPRLLHLTRINFLPDLPYEMEARLLLSPLFHELGDGLYEIKPELRDLLLAALDARFGSERLQRMAVLLERYTDLRSSWPDSPELAHAQRLTALHVLRPDEALQWLADNEAAASTDTGLAPTWFVAMRRQINTTPPDRALLERLLDGAVRQLRQPDRRRRVADVLTVAALLALLGASVAYAIEALRAAISDGDPAVRRAARDALPRAEAEVRHDQPPSDEVLALRASPDGLADPAESRVVLIGGDGLPGPYRLPEVKAALLDLVDVLTDREVWGVDRRHCQVLLGADRSQAEEALRRAADEVGPDGLLLVHFAGHGLVDPDGTIVFGIAGTDPEQPRLAGLPYPVVEGYVAASGAGLKLLLFDCVLAGSVSWPRLSPRIDYLLTQGPGLPPVGTGSPALTRELTRLLWSGVPGQGALLDLRAIHAALNPNLPLLLQLRHDSSTTPLVRNRAWPESTLVGRVLVVAPDGVDPDVVGPGRSGAVVLVLRHHPREGTLGVRLDDPSDRAVDLPADWSRLVAPPPVEFRGGTPATRPGFVAVAQFRADERPSPGFRALRARIGVLLRFAEPARRPPRIRLFRGYLGWEPGHLESLLAEGIVWRADPEQATRRLLTDQPEKLWDDLTRDVEFTPQLRGGGPSRSDFDLLLAGLAWRIRQGHRLTLLLGDGVSSASQVRARRAAAAEISERSPGERSYPDPHGDRQDWAVGRLLARCGAWFDHRVFTTRSAGALARAIRAEGRAATVSQVGTERAAVGSGDTVRVFQVQDDAGGSRYGSADYGRRSGWSPPPADRLSRLITGDHVYVVGHHGEPGSVMAALRRLQEDRGVSVSWVAAPAGESEAELSIRTTALRHLLGRGATPYPGVTADTFLTALCRQFGALPSAAPRLGSGVRFPRGEEEFVVDPG